jgi:hypothetical protein
VIARSFDELKADSRHTLCASAAPIYRKFFSLISIDSAWKLHYLASFSLWSTYLHHVFRGRGAIRTAPKKEFESAFLVEKEYFLRTMHLLQPSLDPPTEPARKVNPESSQLIHTILIEI